MSQRILFITPLPPPVHGSAMVSQYIKDSKLVNGQFDCDFVNLSTSRKMDEIGKGGAKKLLRFVGSYFALLYKLMTQRYDLCYLAITCHDKGFLKDAPFVLLCKLFRRKVLIHQHNKGMSGCVNQWPYRWLLPMVYRNTTVMLLSWHLYDDISKVVGREQVVICANGIPQITINDERLTINDYGLTINENENAGAEGGLIVAERQVNRNEALVKSCEAAVKGNDDEETAVLYENEDENCHPDGEDAAELQTVVCCPLSVDSIEKEDVKLLFLSNLIESKGIYVLLDACKVLKERGLDFTCDFVGGESKAVSGEAFCEAIAERGLADRVIYHGPQYGEDKGRFFTEADIFVQPTFDDCFPLTLVEAMQYRLPIVSTDVGAIPDMIVEGVNGLMCQQRDVPSLVVALETLIKDGALRTRMGEQGYARYKALYTLEAFEERFVEALGFNV